MPRRDNAAGVARIGSGERRKPYALCSLVQSFGRFCCKNSLTIQDVATATCSSLLQNVAKIFFAKEPNCLTVQWRTRRCEYARDGMGRQSDGSSAWDAPFWRLLHLSPPLYWILRIFQR